MVTVKKLNPKVVNAFRAMKRLGISRERVKPALKKLLMLYDKNWHHIEEGNYRVLLDTIFEEEEAAAEEPPKKNVDTEAMESSMMIVLYDEGEDMDEDMLETGDFVRHSESPQIINQDCQYVSLQNSNSGVHSPHVIAENTRVALQINKNDKSIASTAKCGSPLDSMSRNKGKKLVSPRILCNGKGSVHENSSYAGGYEVPMLVQEKSAIPPLENHVAAVFHPNTSKASEEETSSLIASSSELESAFSPSGEVKMFLSCNLAIQKPDFVMPTCEAVIKLAEDKCIKSFKITDPNFSLKYIMKEICQFYLELVSKSNRNSLETTNNAPSVELVDTIQSSSMSQPKETLEVTPCSEHRTVDITQLNGSIGIAPASNNLDMTFETDLINKFSAAEGLCAGGLISSVNGSAGPQTNDMRLVEIQQPQVTPEMIRSGHSVDVTKGLEKVPIFLVNGVNSASPPPFHYIPQNVVYEKANVNFSMACILDGHCCSTWSDNCLFASVCTCASRSGFAYSLDGLLKEDFLAECISMKRDPVLFFCKESPLERSKRFNHIGSCRGHHVKKVIKECWMKCECDKNCGNRVVQKGITRNLQIFTTPEGKRWGLRTVMDLPKGAFICEYAGEILTAMEILHRSLQSPEGKKNSSYTVLLDADCCTEGVVKDEDALGIDSSSYGNVARFINHRCYDANLVEIPVQIETADGNNYYHVALFTTRNVKAMEELTWDYGTVFDEKDRFTKPFGCICGSTFCRGK